MVGSPWWSGRQGTGVGLLLAGARLRVQAGLRVNTSPALGADHAQGRSALPGHAPPRGC
jgi:hypothetical protein